MKGEKRDEIEIRKTRETKERKEERVKEKKKKNEIRKGLMKYRYGNLKLSDKDLGFICPPTRLELTQGHFHVTAIHKSRSMLDHYKNA